MMLQDIEKRKEESKHGDVDGEGKGKGGEEKQKRDRKDLVGLEGKAVKEVQTQPRAKL